MRSLSVESDELADAGAPTELPKVRVNQTRFSPISIERPSRNCSKYSRPIFRQGLDLPPQYMANVRTVGQDKSPSRWGNYDQGGNVVEILDTLAPQRADYNFLRNWRYYRAGVANAPA
jgi:hypothetical protein